MKIIRTIKSFFANVNRLIYWLPVIWKDRNWDDAYILIILNHKLKHMEKFYRSDDTYSMEALGIADEIHHVQTILQRLVDGNHLNVALEEYESKYEIGSLMRLTDGGVIWSEDEDQIAMFRKAGEEADEAEKKDFDDLFDYMKKNIQNWWD